MSKHLKVERTTTTFICAILSLYVLRVMALLCHTRFPWIRKSSTKKTEMAYVTLEFIQRCFLRMNPDKGSKRRKSAMNQKVLTLLNKLMDFEWC
ncbi:unnamed protein product [Larinioides sclopetarius]|uniref:Secreted protein n=1 Tax=Larinioides sclopetarius TaxID=280406 RepID=A0AAV2B0K3_9ARAC